MLNLCGIVVAILKMATGRNSGTALVSKTFNFDVCNKKKTMNITIKGKMQQS
jgi:hypothetical protein